MLRPLLALLAASSFVGALLPALYLTRGHRTLFFAFPAHTDALVIVLGIAVGLAAACIAAAGRRSARIAGFVGLGLAIAALAFGASTVALAWHRDWQFSSLEVAAFGAVAWLAATPALVLGASPARLETRARAARTAAALSGAVVIGCVAVALTLSSSSFEDRLWQFVAKPYDELLPYLASLDVDFSSVRIWMVSRIIAYGVLCAGALGAICVVLSAAALRAARRAP